MKTKILLSILALGIIVSALGQNIELTFTAIDSAAYTQLDSIKVMNQTQGSDTMLYWPDTVLMLYLVGIHENSDKDLNFQLMQNYPNPVLDRTTISICVPERDVVKTTITDILGRQVINKSMILDKGNHNFTFKPGNTDIYIFTVSWNGISQSIKILNTGQGTNGHCSLEYIASNDVTPQTKSTTATQDFSFTIGDILLYIGYFDTLQSGMQDSPEASDDYTFQFATNMPCPGTPTIDYGGQIYNTIQVYNQCWMKENLNIGTMLYAPTMPTNNDTIEKYCMGDMQSYCDIMGGLYMWEELMNYTYETGGQGICPDGWHVPDDLDWQILEGAVDSKFRIGDPEWENSQWRGMDAGGNLKQTGTTNWEPPNNGATDAYGFTALPGGYFVQGAYWGPGYKGYFYSSDIEEKYYRNID